MEPGRARGRAALIRSALARAARCAFGRGVRAHARAGHPAARAGQREHIAGAAHGRRPPRHRGRGLAVQRSHRLPRSARSG